MILSLEPWLQHSPGCASFNLYDNGRSRECDCGLDAARAEGRPSPEGGEKRADELQEVVSALYKAWPDAEDIASDWPNVIIGSIEQIIRERDEARASWAVCRQSLHDQAAARRDPSMPALVPEVIEAWALEAEASYAMAETADERRNAHGLSLLVEWQRAALSTPSPEAGREEDLRAEVLAIFKANKMATDERLAILIAERLSSRLSPPAPEPGYEAEPVAWRWRYVKDRPWKYTDFAGSVVAGNAEVQPLYASPVPVSREEIAEEIWRRFAPSYEETFAECANRSEYLLAADAILQRLSNQQKEG